MVCGHTFADNVQNRELAMLDTKFVARILRALRGAGLVPAWRGKASLPEGEGVGRDVAGEKSSYLCGYHDIVMCNTQKVGERKDEQCLGYNSRGV